MFLSVSVSTNLAGTAQDNRVLTGNSVLPTVESIDRLEPLVARALSVVDLGRAAVCQSAALQITLSDSVRWDPGLPTVIVFPATVSVPPVRALVAGCYNLFIQMAAFLF